MKSNVIYALLAMFLVSIMAFSASAVTINSINLDPTSGKAPLDVKFSATLAGTGPYLYAWDLGDGFTATKSSFEHTYSAAGKYDISLTVKDESDNSTDTKASSISVEAAAPLKVSASANPVSGNAPLTVSFTVAVTGESPFTYEWDFDGDRNTYSTDKSASFTYSTPDTYEATVKVTDDAGNTNTDSVKIYVTKFDPKINVESYSPKTFNINTDVTMSIIISNSGSEYLSNIDAKTLSDKVVFKKSTSISSLAPSDQDSIAITFTPTVAGKYNLPVKILGKNFNIAVEAVDVNKQFNASDLQAKIDQDKATLEAMKKDCLEKYNQKYLLGDTCDSITLARNSLDSIQSDMLAGKLASVNTALTLLQNKMDDLQSFLKNAEKPKKSFMDLLKENAAWITTVLAAFAALGGFFAKMRSRAKALAEKAHHHIKSTLFSKGKEMPQAANEAKEHAQERKEQKPKSKKAKKK